MKTLGLLILATLWTPCLLQAEDLGSLSANPFDADSHANPYNPHGRGWRSEGK